MPELLTVAEVAELLRWTPSALRYQIHIGNAPKSAKIGKRRMFRRSEVEAWLSEKFTEVA